MRKTLLPLLSVAVLTLAGCNSSNSPSADGSSPASSDSAAKASIPNAVSGTLSVKGPAPSSSAVLVLNLVDVSSNAAGSAPLATKTSPAGSFPQPFKLSFDPSKVKPDDLYVVKAKITDGPRIYTMPIQAPVLAKNSKNDAVAITLDAQQTPAEVLLSKFQDVQKNLGNMKVTNGTKLEKDDSRSWQMFREDGKVKLIRELVEYVDKDKGFTSTDYAYKDDKPWVIEQKHEASHGAKPSSIDYAGWDDSGDLVLKRHQVGNDNQELDADTASTLKSQAKNILSLATHGKNK